MTENNTTQSKRVSDYISMRMFGRLTAAIVIILNMVMMFTLMSNGIISTDATVNGINNHVENMMLITLTAAIMYLWNPCDKSAEK